MSQAQSSNPSSSNRERFAEPVACKKCGQHGSIFWEENAVGNRASGSQRELIRISNGFHREMERTLSGDPIVACDNCGERLPDGGLTVRLKP